jgi:hypothetical protein
MIVEEVVLIVTTGLFNTRAFFRVSHFVKVEPRSVVLLFEDVD